MMSDVLQYSRQSHLARIFSLNATMPFLMIHVFAAGNLHAIGSLQLFETPQALSVRRLRSGLFRTCGYADTGL